MEAWKTRILYILSILVLTLGGLNWFQASQIDKIKNGLTEKDLAIQIFNEKLGLAHAKLYEIDELNKKYKKDIDDFPAKLKKIISEYDLKLASRDQTIANLKNTVDGGESTVVVNDGAGEGATQQISYTWSDDLGRFKLSDPDIFIKNNERFTYNQHFEITGHVLYGKDGQLQIKKIDLWEVVPDGHGNFVKVPNGKLKLVKSEFEYGNMVDHQKSLLDIVHPRLIGTFDTELDAGIGVELVNLGHFIDWANVGLALNTAFDLANPLNGSLPNSRIGVLATYTIIPPLFSSNFGIGLGLSTPYNKFANEWVFTLSTVFYITN